MAAGPFFEEWFDGTLGPLFEDFDMVTFNVMDLMDMDIPQYILK